MISIGEGIALAAPWVAVSLFIWRRGEGGLFGLSLLLGALLANYYVLKG